MAAAQTVEVSSVGSVALQLQTLGISGPQADDFSIVSNDCDGQLLASGETCEVTIDFGPLTSGGSSASLQVPSSDAGSPHAVELRGAVRGIFRDGFELP